ncbi:Glucose 1-dehydrogenase [Tetrabaena socialis]|uniref:Glucose 1-dehydrogenase n=1 Tax=Tetrabaena socialis TaxID=47790 RepID=A0A2J8A5Z8_9CHLO|nr:Glucose 1-dehydrogenase [Tetrabaena socialis]|eukprot:PNH07927.1 Glucose 1-dehydrogenase [Tetrabaena socialis]
MAALASQRLLGKVAVVTGGARGIGYGCARSLCREAQVLLADYDLGAAQRSAAELTTAGHSAAAVKCDVRLKADCDAAVAAAVAEWGKLDIMVANAGIVKAAPFLDMSEEDFDDVVAVNLKGVFLSCQAAARQMVAHRQSDPAWSGGAIVTMSSVNAVMAIPSIAGYNASKGGVNGLTRCMALALAPHGIRVNSVGPGSINTDVLAAVASDPAARGRILSRTPLGRIGEADEVGAVVAFLASEAASYMSGQVVYVDGGRLALNYTVPVPQPEPAEGSS